MMKATSKLSEKLASGKLALTAACLPPHDTDAAAMKKLAACFPAAIDSVVVADNPSKVRGSALACAALLAAEKVEPMLSLITRDRNRIALESDVLGAAALGVKSFLCLTGAHQVLGAGPQAAGAFDIDSVQLCQALAKMTGAGVDFDGNKLPSAPNFGIAASVHPYLRPVELAVLQARKKVVAGAQVLLTDPVFDVEGFEVWMKAVRAAGLDKQAAVVASVLPLASVAQAEFLRARSGFAPIPDAVIAKLKAAESRGEPAGSAGGGPSRGGMGTLPGSPSTDVAAAGIGIVAEIVARLKAIPGVRGIHILSDGCEALVPKILQEARLA
jgi:methylenetetrahydrofolate reductase (NADPH)